jgi:hypothetical protein
MLRPAHPWTVFHWQQGGAYLLRAQTDILWNDGESFPNGGLAQDAADRMNAILVEELRQLRRDELGDAVAMLRGWRDGYQRHLLSIHKLGKSATDEENGVAIMLWSAVDNLTSAAGALEYVEMMLRDE